MLRSGVGPAATLLAVTLVVLSGSASMAETAKPADKTQQKTQPAAKGQAKAESGIVPPAPERKDDTPAAAAVPPKPDVWQPAEIEAAKAQCAAALKGLNVLVSYEEPIKEGECGTPAPIRLVKLDNITFTPAALINCGMLAPLHTWITKDLQPLAKRQFGSKITTIEVMSDYSCRTAFGRVGKKLSQHAYVDALDIRGFVTDKNQQVMVLETWGATNRDIAAAKARDEKIMQAAQAAAAQAGQARSAPAAPDTKLSPAAKRVPGEVDVVTSILPGGAKRQTVARLGGPPDKHAADKAAAPKHSVASESRIASLSPAATKALARPQNTPGALFLRDAHAAACRIFGTTLGPEANEAHRNHFHVDMAERKIKKICD
jgi:hypothetical protein